MSKSYRTQPPRILAERKTKEPQGTKIIERKCIKGDYNPLNKKMITDILLTLPIEYTYGLKKVELLDRNSRDIGEPYAIYREDEKSIQIYSVPKAHWVFENLGDWSKNNFYEHGANQFVHEKTTEIMWENPLDLAYFIFSYIFVHFLT